METVRWGVVGTGGMAAKMAATLASVEEARVVAVGSRSLDTAEFFAGAHGIEAAVGSHDAVATCEDVDVVYVATTNELHHANVLASIAAGKPVLCEKPLALNRAQAHEMIESARQADLFLMEAMWMRFQPFLAKVDELIESGAIGNVGHLQATFGFPANPDPQRRWFSRSLGGGSLLDLGIYPVTLAYHVLGPPTSCSTEADVSTEGIDRQITIASTHPGGAMSTLSASILSDTANEAVISGTKGRIRVHAPFHHSRLVTLEREGAVVATFDVGYDGSGLEFQIDHVHRCLEAGHLESPTMPSTDSLAILAWMDAVRRQSGVMYPGE
ncbi:MAG: Gfo/Idh/MocA family protein [Acidimicrobiia bacterium]